jgi:DNA processing protein
MLLQQLPQAGAGTQWRLLEHFATLEAAFAAPTQQLQTLLHPHTYSHLRAVLEAGESHPEIQRLREQQGWLHQQGIHLVDTQNDYYPSLLREVKRAPVLLYVWGDPTLLNLPQVAIVGSRNPTASGRQNAAAFARDLASAGFVITSGLALGIDVAAHQGALESHGRTLAVLGTGINQIYPARHVCIAEQIAAQGGAVVSEFPLGTGALPANFPQRNRIISGLSCGVLVVEAAIKSGSLITARYALQQNREVFAIPGSLQNPLSRGCHALIKEGAKLVECAEDVVDELHSLLAYKRSELSVVSIPQQACLDLPITDQANLLKPAQTTPHEAAILACFEYDAVTFDAIAEHTQLPIGDVMASLLTLELKGLVANLGHGYALIRS